MAKRNPYRTVEKAFTWAGKAIFALLISFAVFLAFVLVPLKYAENGEPWYTVWAPYLLLVAFPVLALLLAGVGYLVTKFITEPWRERKDAWNRAEQRETPLDPEPYITFDAAGEVRLTLANVEGLPVGNYYFRPREGFNGYEWVYYEQA